MVINKNIALFSVISITVVLLDQLSKYWVLDFFSTAHIRQSVEIFSFLNLVLVYNPGISFGLFPDTDGGMIWGSIGLALTAYLSWMLWQEKHKAMRIALSLAIGGALGNIIDRWIHGAVVDFIDFHLNNWHFPAFNIADAAISVGMFIYCLGLLAPKLLAFGDE